MHSIDDDSLFFNVTNRCLFHLVLYICRLRIVFGTELPKCVEFSRQGVIYFCCMKAVVRLCLFLGLISMYGLAAAQQPVLEGEVNIIQDERVNTLIEKHIQANTAFNGLTGYRIQIFFDSGSNAKNRANNERRRFMTLFPQARAYVTFDAPNFKVRVGNFRTRLEAEKWLRDIQKHFEMAYVVPSRIELPPL